MWCRLQTRNAGRLSKVQVRVLRYMCEGAQLQAMKVLDKEEKDVYESLNIPFKFVDCWDVKVPESWKNIKVAKFG